MKKLAKCLAIFWGIVCVLNILVMFSCVFYAEFIFDGKSYNSPFEYYGKFMVVLIACLIFGLPSFIWWRMLEDG